MANTDEQLSLFDDPRPKRQPFRRPPPVSIARYSKITSTRYRDLCDDCCMDIHRLGQEFAPFPRRATWRRSSNDGAVLLCQAHKDTRVEHDSR